MSHILAGIDFSPVSEAVVREAERLAGAGDGAQVTLLHVAAPDPEFVGYDAGPQTVRDARATELRREHATLGAWADAIRSRGIETRAVLVAGPTVDTILGKAREVGASTIILGSHGHGRLYDAIVGSVSAGVIRDATCPVLVVPSRRPS